MGAWIKLKKADLTRMPVLDVRTLTDEQIGGLSELFDELSESGFERLPGMVDCGARSRLDAGLSEVLGLPELVGLRRLLASEPVVSNGRL